MEDNLKKITEIFNEARSRGLCHNQKEFAALLDVSPSTVSSAMNGSKKALTHRLITKIERWAQRNFNDAQKAPKKPDVLIPGETVELYTAMAKSIDRLSALVEQLTLAQTMAGSGSSTDVPAYKKTLPEDITVEILGKKETPCFTAGGSTLKHK